MSVNASRPEDDAAALRGAKGGDAWRMAMRRDTP
jgi:hypothetical protein